ncbi:MAG: protein kinase, partial [Chloroflexota bacterium]
MTDLIGKNLGRYQIISRVGRGGMARVYKAYQASLDRLVALKVLHSHLAEDPDFVGRFEREAAAVARLRHPNIVQVFDYDKQDDLYFIVMEFVEGPTLKAEISERAKRQDDPGPHLFDLDEVVRLFSALADAIDYAHSSGMIHRDLKPGNIMFTTEGRVMLTDFGLAKLVYASKQSATGALSGTPAYMAPEQVEGGRVDERSDIYSLGVMLFELFAGRTPFIADTPYKIMTMHVTEEVPSLSQFNSDLPADLETVIFKALSKDPDRRFQSAGEFSGALQEATGVFVIQSTTGGQVAPIATLADSQEMTPASSIVGVSELSLAAITSPYRGLYAFREEDAPYFFGRETFTERLSNTLREKSMAAVIGPSGSGKSSVVFAGLLPKLQETKSWT